MIGEVTVLLSGNQTWQRKNIDDSHRQHLYIRVFPATNSYF